MRALLQVRPIGTFCTSLVVARNTPLVRHTQVVHCSDKDYGAFHRQPHLFLQDPADVPVDLGDMLDSDDIPGPGASESSEEDDVAT